MQPEKDSVSEVVSQTVAEASLGLETTVIVAALLVKAVARYLFLMGFQVGPTSTVQEEASLVSTYC